MRKFLVVAFVIALVGMVYFLTNVSKVSSYETIANAVKQEGRFVHIVASLDKEKNIIYDPIKDPNRLIFYVRDSTYYGMKVVYLNAKPTDLEKSEKIVLKGKFRKDYFECKDILLKCPSKYKDENKTLPVSSKLNG